MDRCAVLWNVTGGEIRDVLELLEFSESCFCNALYIEELGTKKNPGQTTS